MVGAPSTSAPTGLGDIKPLLEKKASFEKGVARLKEELLRSGGAVAQEPEYAVLLARTHTLLRSRYNSVVFWTCARDLYKAVAGGGARLKLATQLAGYLGDCDAHLADGGEEPSLAAAPAPYSFQGQLSGAAPAAAPLGAGSAALEALLAHVMQLPQGAQVPAQGMGETGLDPDLLRALEESMADAPQGAPPASKAVVSSLPREVLTPERLAHLGGVEARCPVCMEELAVGDTVQALPCAHVYHVPCLAPWLKDHNSCPTCRHELPTDDTRYERDKQELEDQKGAANAVSHAEFMYL